MAIEGAISAPYGGMTDDFLRRLRERLDPAHAEELARSYHEACDPRSLSWDQLSLDRRTRLTEAMRVLIEHILDEHPHLWAVKYELVVCERCGVVRRRDGKNPSCPRKLPSVLPRQEP